MPTSLFSEALGRSIQFLDIYPPLTSIFFGPQYTRIYHYRTGVILHMPNQIWDLQVSYFRITKLKEFGSKTLFRFFWQFHILTPIIYSPGNPYAEQWEQKPYRQSSLRRPPKFQPKKWGMTSWGCYLTRTCLNMGQT